MRKIEELAIAVKFRIIPELSFWHAVKLRIAGKQYSAIAEKIGETICEKIKASSE